MSWKNANTKKYQIGNFITSAKDRVQSVASDLTQNISETAGDVVEGAKSIYSSEPAKTARVVTKDLVDTITGVKALERKKEEQRQLKKRQFEESGGWTGRFQRLWEDEDWMGQKTGIKETFINKPIEFISETIENTKENFIEGQANEYENLFVLHRQIEYEELNKNDSPFLTQPFKSNPKISLQEFKTLSHKERADILNTLKDDPYVKKIEYDKVSSDLNDLNEELEDMELYYRNRAKEEIDKGKQTVRAADSPPVPLSDDEASKIGEDFKLRFLDKTKDLRDEIKNLENKKWDLTPDKEKDKFI